jgi:hypothetical protein
MPKSLVISVIEHAPQNRVSDIVMDVTLNNINGIVSFVPL